MILLGGSASGRLSENLASEMGVSHAEVTVKRFPDEECYVRINTDLTGEDVVLVQNSYPDPNLVELLLFQDAVREFGAANLVSVIPYFGYARQDRKFNDGEPVSARAMASVIQVNTDAVITVDLHKASTIEWFDKKARNVSAMPQIGRYLKELSVDMVVSPDKGAAPLAELTAQTVGCPWDYLEKTRIDSNTVRIAPKSMPVEGRTVAIVDDIIATGGTIITASKQLKEAGAEKVIAACSHGLYTGGAVDKIKAGVDKLVSTDTLESETSEITAAPEIAKAVIELLK